MEEKEFSLSKGTARQIAESMGVELFSVSKEIESIQICMDRIKTLAQYAYLDLLDDNEDCIGRVLNSLCMIREEADRLSERLDS